MSSHPSCAPGNTTVPATPSPVAPTDWPAPHWPFANAQALQYVHQQGLQPPPWDDLRAALRLDKRPRAFPEQAVRQLQAGWPLYAPALRQVMDDLTANRLPPPDNHAFLHHIGATLLAEHRDPGCWPVAQNWLARPQRWLEQWFGEDWMETVNGCIGAWASHDAAHMDALAQIALEPGRWAHQRFIALNALAQCTGEGLFAQAQFVQVCRQVFASVLAGQCVTEGKDDWLSANAFLELVLITWADFGVATDDLPMIDEGYQRGLVSPRAITREELTRPIDLSHLPQLPGCTVGSLRNWYCFTEEFAREQDRQLAGGEPWHIHDATESPQQAIEQGLPFVRPDPKVGRNDPCPCGSGKKYKKCCGA